MTIQAAERQLLLENEELRRRLAEAEEALRAIRAGEVDAVLVEAERDQVFTLESADKPYRLLVEQMPQGAATLTAEGAILYCNRRFADLLKRPLQSLLGKLIHDFVAPDSRPSFEALLRDGQAGDVQGEVTLQRADGTAVPVYLGVSALQEGVLGLCLIVTDLTEQEARKKAERFADRITRLQQVTAALSEALTVDQVAEVIITHGLAALGANVGVVATLTDDGNEFVNLRVVGYPREMVEDWSRFPADAPLPMADAARLGRPIMLGTLADRDARYPELARLKALEGDGALVALPLLVRGRAVGAMRLAFPTSRTFSADDLAYMLTLAQQCAQALERARLYDTELRARERAEKEIEDRKRAEEALQASEAQFRQLADALPQIVWTARPDGFIDYYNERWYEFTGFPRGEYGDASWKPILHPDDVQRCVDTYYGCIRSGQLYQIEYRFKDRVTGGYRWFLGRAYPVRDEQGGIVRWFGTCTDIDDTKRAEEALREADRRKDEFLATLAHELRNPLAPIRNALHILRLPGGRDQDSAEVQGMMERQVEHLVRLVDDLLEISRITRGKIELRRQRVELATVVRNALETSRPLIEAAGHRLTVALPPEPVVLDADPIRLAQVVANLLSNAAKYTENGGRIWLTAELAPSSVPLSVQESGTGGEGVEVVIRVRDTGIGIPAEMLPRVFEMFTQVDRSSKRAQGGLGIGLSLVRGLVQMHGGSVEAASAGPGQGSEFTVRLPLAAESRPSPEAAGPAAPRPTATPLRRILVVDDLPDAANSLGTLLRLAGTDVQVAYDGPGALAALRTYRPDVVLLDIGLPKMDGYEVARQIRQQPEFRDVVLIALTGWAQEEDRRRSRAAGFDHHLVKPVDFEALQALLGSLETSPRRVLSL